jgi:hypothetical protein
MPEFICGLNYEQLAARVQDKDHLKVAISSDGAAFDSNQHPFMQQACQQPLWDRYIPLFERWMAENGARYP